MKTSNPSWSARVDEIFAAAPFVQLLGITLDEYAPGRCVTGLQIVERHRQQDGYVHAGVLATLADHTAGAAAGTLMPAGQIVLTLEFKIHLLRAAKGPTMRCVAEVLKPGKQFAVVESSVYEGERLVAKLSGTMAYVAAP